MARCALTEETEDARRYAMATREAAADERDTGGNHGSNEANARPRLSTTPTARTHPQINSPHRDAYIPSHLTNTRGGMAQSGPVMSAHARSRREITHGGVTGRTEGVREPGS